MDQDPVTYRYTRRRWIPVAFEPSEIRIGGVALPPDLPSTGSD